MQAHLPPLRRVVVALDASPHSFSTLDTALSLAVLLGLEIHGLFVEDIQLHQAARHPFAQEISRFSTTPQPHNTERLEQQFHAQRTRIARIFQQRAQHAQLTHAFLVQRGQVSSTIQKMLHPQDLLGLGCVGNSPHPTKALGSNASYLLQHTLCPILMSRKELSFGNDIFLIFDGSQASIQGLYWGALLAAQAGREAIHTLLWKPPHQEIQKKDLQELLHSHAERLPLSLRISTLQPPSILHLSRFIDPNHPGILLIPEDELVPPTPLLRWMGLFHCPVIVLRNLAKPTALAQ